MIPVLASLLLTVPGGEVTLPLSEWEKMLAEVDAAERAPPPPIPTSPISRSIEGQFRRGLLDATLVLRFEHRTDSHTRVPIVDGRASLGEVTLDGRPSSVLREGGMYTVGVDSPGVHEVKARFLWGREQDRFTRRLTFNVPEGGVTGFGIAIPEQEIDARLPRGAITSARAAAGGTRLEGFLDASGAFDLSWNRRLGHGSKGRARTEATVGAVITLSDAMARGVEVVDVTVQEGEIDRIDLSVPPELEIVKVEGDAVLQWQTDPTDNGRLAILLRYLVEDSVRAAVHFQLPAEPKAVTVGLPLPAEGTPFTGVLGVQAPAGLDVQPGEFSGAETLSLRDVPAELADLATSPLRVAFSFSAPPKVALAIERHGEVELTTTIVDEIEASTVVLESGMEVTKMKLRVRNNTRQHMSMTLPEDAVLTHALIDGQPFRPGITSGGAEGREALLIALRQSQKLGPGGERNHVVREGETLSDIANFYYADPTAWQPILNGNQDQLAGEGDLQVGQTLRVPSKSGAAIEESSFVIEIAYKRGERRLGLFGSRSIQLPALDVEVVNATWHAYFPTAYDPLAFDGNLTQYSALRYDPFRRARDFIRSALSVSYAWAGGSAYRSILLDRKVIYMEENEKKAQADVVLSSFPLVGERYRFKRILLGRETPAIDIRYANRTVARAMRWLAFAAAFGLALVVFRRKDPRATWLAAGSLVVLLVAAHYFLGVHRRILWGVDLALLVALVRANWGAIRTRIAAWWKEPWALGRHLSLGGLAKVGLLTVFVWLVVAYPLFLSTITLALLGVLHRRANRKTEVAHEAAA